MLFSPSPNHLDGHGAAWVTDSTSLMSSSIVRRGRVTLMESTVPVRQTPAFGWNVTYCVLNRQLLAPSLAIAVWSWTRPGRHAPTQMSRSLSSHKVVAFTVLRRCLPEMNCLRPGWPAGGRRTRMSVLIVSALLTGRLEGGERAGEGV